MTIDERAVEVVWSPARQAKVEALCFELRTGVPALMPWSAARQAKVKAIALRLRQGVSFMETDYPFAIHQS